MIKYHETDSDIKIAEITGERFMISQVQEIIDIMADIGSSGCNRIMIHERNLHKDFFNLKTGLAGEILQKFSNYHVKLAIVGDFSKVNSMSLKDFIIESNKGNMIFFVANIDTALLKLRK
jgi:hypothetical protein